MKKISTIDIIGGLILTTVALFTGLQINAYAKSGKNSYPVITLTAKNTVTFRSVFTGESVAAAQGKLLEISGKLPKDEPIYLFLDTPGGNVIAGEQLIGTINGLPHEVKTITGFAASMGFITAQSLGERLILPNGILMSHRATIGVQGQLPGEFNVMSKFWADLVDSIEVRMANRLQMPPNDYKNLVHDEYWVVGNKAVAAKSADKVVNVRCGEDLQNSYKEAIATIFGKIYVTWSNCPLISSPLDVSFNELESSSIVELERIKQTVFEVLSNPRNFVTDPILQQNFYKYVR